MLAEPSSHRSSQQSQYEVQLTQKIKILELDNTDLKSKLATCR